MSHNSKFPKVSTVVLNWENFADTKRCVNSLLNSGYPELRILIVDNGSKDDSARLLRDEFPNLTFLINDANLGFARACNLGIREALGDSDCRYVLLLNNDATIAQGALEVAVQFTEADAQIGAISGKILFPSEPPTISYAGGRIDRWRGQAIVRGFGEVDCGQYESACEVGFVTGAMMLVKREVLERVGLLPEDYFFGVEEWDYSVRVKLSGYRLYYVPQFVGYHRADGSHWNYDPKFVYNSYRNKLIFQERYLPPLIFLLWKETFRIYAKHLARRARQRLITAHHFAASDVVDLDDLDFALASALKDHKKNVLSDRVLAGFEAELRARKRS